MLAETESPFVANVTIIFNSVPSTLIDPTHGPSGDWEEANGAMKRAKAKSGTRRGFMGENLSTGVHCAFPRPGTVRGGRHAKTNPAMNAIRPATKSP